LSHGDVTGMPEEHPLIDVKVPKDLFSSGLTKQAKIDELIEGF